MHISLKYNKQQKSSSLIEILMFIYLISRAISNTPISNILPEGYP